MAQTPSALAAVDMALFDLLGKVSGLPLWQLLGGYRDRIATSVTVGILPERETVAQARRWVQQGFHAVKIKGGRNVEEDAARVIQVREAVGDSVDLRFDANQGYTVEQAVWFLERTAPARLQFLEQPTPQAEPELLKEVSQRVAVGVMADESLLTLDDAYRLARENGCRLFNVKLMKEGGIDQARKIGALAQAAGIGVMTGCMDESALGIAAGLHFSLAEPVVAWADLDGHLGLIGDPAADSLCLRDGILFPSDSPGLGIKLHR
jgi:L-alanine-DL-glutamate epimerase-like enolase superfamily enzyme